MCEKCNEAREEKFHACLITDDEAHSVETDFTIGELEETLRIVTDWAILGRDPAALKIASLFAFTAKRFEEVSKERSMYKAHFEAFREAVEEIKELPAEDIKETLERLLEKDEDLASLLSMLAEMM